jgi:hypothetical protein
MSKISRRTVRAHLITGVVFILLGPAQFGLFLGLDHFGVIEVGNALGHGLLLFVAPLLGLVLLSLALVLALLTGRT